MDLSPATVLQNIAQFKTQALGTLFSPGASAANDIFASLLSQKIDTDKSTTQAAVTPSANKLTASGRNAALFDPESAYTMMSLINQRDVLYKAQYSELGQISTGVAQMQSAGASLGNISANTTPEEIADRLQHFVDQYNDWRSEFNSDVQAGGLLQGTQAAEISLYELEQSAKNIFFGAQDGVHGLGDLGISIDANTHLANFDSSKLKSTLESNASGVISAIQDFSQNFTKSAALLNSENNFLPRQLDNLNRAIHYIDKNKTALTQEFGSGDPARPTGKIAEALAAYQRVYG